jgi:hypothetical protein
MAFILGLLAGAGGYSLLVWPRYWRAQKLFLTAVASSRAANHTPPRPGEEWAKRWGLSQYYEHFASSIDLQRRNRDPNLEPLRREAMRLFNLWLWGMWPLAIVIGLVAWGIASGLGLS